MSEPQTQRCNACGEYWWDAHACQKGRVRMTSSNSETTHSEPTVQGGFEGSPKQDHPVGASVGLPDAASEALRQLDAIDRMLSNSGMEGDYPDDAIYAFILERSKSAASVRNQALEDAAVIAERGDAGELSKSSSDYCAKLGLDIAAAIRAAKVELPP